MKNERYGAIPGLEQEEQEWGEVIACEMEAFSERDVRTDTDVYQEEKAFVVDNDAKADWALRKITEEKEEYDRIRQLAEEQRARIDQKEEAAKRRFEQRTSYLKSLLNVYFQQVPHKRTKTKESYRLLSGSLVLKLPPPKAAYDEDELVQYLKDNKMPDLVKTEEKAKWGEFKKLLDLSLGTHPVIKDTGELVECIRLEEMPPRFEVEV